MNSISCELLKYLVVEVSPYAVSIAEFAINVCPVVDALVAVNSVSIKQ